MDDTISRQAAVLQLSHNKSIGDEEWRLAVENDIKTLWGLPSAQTDIHYRKMGEWDMFELITSTWYGKQYYFMQDDEIVYSRASGKCMSVDKAIDEFLSAIGDN